MVKPVKEVPGKPSDVYEFDPTPDITAYEIAILLKTVKITANAHAYKRFPEEVKRHFIAKPREQTGKSQRR